MKKKICTILLFFSFCLIQKIYNNSKNEIIEHYHKAKISLIDLLHLTPNKPELFDSQPISILSLKIPTDIKCNIEFLKKKLRTLNYSSEERKYYENKNIKDLYEILESTNKKDPILKSLDQILRHVYLQIDPATFNKTSYLLFKGPLKRKREDSIHQKMELIFINTMVCASEIYKRIDSNSHVYPIKLMQSILFQKPSSIPFSISYSQIAGKDTYDFEDKNPIIESFKKLEELRVNTSVSKNWKIFISNLRNDHETLKILTKYKAMGIIKYWAATTFKKDWADNKGNIQKITTNLKSEFNNLRELFNELFYKQYIVSLSNPIHNDNKKLRYQMKILRNQIVPFFSYQDVSSGKKQKISNMASYDFKNTFKQLTPIGKMATLNILNETINALGKFACLNDNKIKEDSMKSFGDLYAHLSRLLDKNEPRKHKKRKPKIKTVVFNTLGEAKTKMIELTNQIMKINNL